MNQEKTFKVENVLLYLSYTNQGDWYKIYDDVKRKVFVEETKIKELKDNLPCGYITILSPYYPYDLSKTSKPPFVLYYKGNIELLKETKTISVVGSRDCSNYGKEMTQILVKDLVKNGYTIISGLAKGIDAIAHKTCIDNGGKTIAVIGQGINKIYPRVNESLYKDIIDKGGLILSEYPPDVNVSKNNFPIRNRIIAGLSKATLVTEARLKSGTLITVRFSLDKGNNIYCVPARALPKSGCNFLIKEGAYLVDSIEDILENEPKY